MQHPIKGIAEDKIIIRLKQPDGTYSYEDNCGGTLGGFWCDALGKLQGWGENARFYAKLSTIYDMEVGFMPGAIKSGETYPAVIEMVYKKNGKEYIATLNLKFIVG